MDFLLIVPVRFPPPSYSLKCQASVRNVGMTQDGWSELVNRVEQLLENEHEGWLNLYKTLHAQMQANQVTLRDLEAQIKRAPHLPLT